MSENGEPNTETEPEALVVPVMTRGEDFRNVRFAEVLRCRIASELGIRSDQLSPACIMDIAQLEEVQKFVDVEGSVTDLLKRYHTKLQFLVDQVQAVTEKVTADTEKLGQENEEENKEHINQPEGKALLEETSLALKKHLISFAQEAAEFYTDMGALYLNLYKDMTNTNKPSPKEVVKVIPEESKGAAPVVPLTKSAPLKKAAGSSSKTTAIPTKGKNAVTNDEKPSKADVKKVEKGEIPVPKPDMQPEESVVQPEITEGKKNSATKKLDAKKKPEIKKAEPKKSGAPAKKK